jgi:hypothetical protein
MNGPADLLQELHRQWARLSGEPRPADYVEVDDMDWFASLFPGVDEGSIETPVRLLGVPVFEVPTLPAHTIRFLPPGGQGDAVRVRVIGGEVYVFTEPPPFFGRDGGA